MLLLAVAFCAGVLTILSPCILPMLPIVLATGATGSRRRTVALGLGFVGSFTFSAALLASVVRALSLPPLALRALAVLVLLVMAVVLLLPPLLARFEMTLQRLSRLALPGRPKAKDGVLGGLAAGASAGLLCAPCAGPVLTAVATLAALNVVTAGMLAVAGAYAVGLGLPLTLLGLGARAAARRARRAARYVQPAAGGLLLLTALALLVGADQQAQQWAAGAEGWTAALQRVETQPAVVEALSRLRGQALRDPSNVLALGNYGPADPFIGLGPWLNSPPLAVDSLRGKVVLIDFWTYSCVNCVRELPHLEAWYRQYAADGLVVVGIHAPEFAFEHDPANVARAVQAAGLTFPVALDNQLATWNAYRNLAWPELYLVDATGGVRYIHVGEGDYGATEAALRTLLITAGRPPAVPPTQVRDTSPTVFSITPELYLGTARLTTLGSPEDVQVGRPVAYTFPATLLPGSVAFDGRWTLGPEEARSDGPARLAVHFYADRLYVVLAPARAGQAATVLLDGRSVEASVAGADVRDGTVTLDRPRLYALVDLHGPPADHSVELRFGTPGVAAYSFTFG